MEIDSAEDGKNSFRSFNSEKGPIEELSDDTLDDYYRYARKKLQLDHKDEERLERRRDMRFVRGGDLA